MYGEGLLYKKVGIFLGGLVAAQGVQQNIFAKNDVKKSKAVMSVLDDLNRSLAAQAVPEERRAQVSDLSLRSKGERAGQKTAEVKDFPKGGR